MNIFKTHYVKIDKLWYICLTVRIIISILPLIFNTFKEKFIIKKLYAVTKYSILIMGLGFLYKSFTGSNDEIQVNKVFWHNTRIIHAILFILGAYNFNNGVKSSRILFLDVLFSITYRYKNGHFN